MPKKIIPVKRQLPVQQPKRLKKTLTKVSVLKKELPEHLRTVPDPAAEPEPEPEPEPKAEPEPKTEPEPAPKAEPEPKAKAEPEPTAEQENSDSDSESEYDIHPKLQELLEYLADESHITIMKTKDLQDIRDDVKYMRDIIRTAPISNTPVSNTPVSNTPVSNTPVSNTPVSNTTVSNTPVSNTPVSSPIVPPVVTIATTIPIPTSAYINEPLAKMIGQLAEENNTNIACMVKYNSVFEANFILDLNGNGNTIAKALKARGFHNCLIIHADVPQNVTNNRIIAYHLSDVLDISKERGYKKINVIADNVKIHKSFTELISYLSDELLDLSDWKVLQYLCTKHNYDIKISDYDENYYKTIIPNISTKIHWKRIGLRGGYIAKPAIVDTTSIDNLAFAINLSDQDTLDSLQKSVNIAKSTDHSVFASITNKLSMVMPNLFISNTSVGESIAKSIKWMECMYENV